MTFADVLVEGWPQKSHVNQHHVCITVDDDWKLDCLPSTSENDLIFQWSMVTATNMDNLEIQLFSDHLSLP